MPPIGQADQGGTVERILFAPDASQGRFFYSLRCRRLCRCQGAKYIVTSLRQMEAYSYEVFQ